MGSQNPEQQSLSKLHPFPLETQTEQAPSSQNSASQQSESTLHPPPSSTQAGTPQTPPSHTPLQQSESSEHALPSSKQAETGTPQKPSLPQMPLQQSASLPHATLSSEHATTAVAQKPSLVQAPLQQSESTAQVEPSSKQAGASTGPTSASILAAVALPLAAFALVAPQIVAQDLPWWDESVYLALGRGLVAGASPDLAWSPACALTLGIARAALGPVRAISVVHVAWAAVFAVAVGLCARALLRDARPALALAAIALGSSHALVVIGPQRAAISLVLLAFAALASRRWPRTGLAAGAILALAAAACRLEAALARWRPRGRPASPRPTSASP